MSFLVGANPETGYRSIKHYAGVIDELRISSTVRYAGSFTPATRHEPDEYTVALYHFDEGEGDVIRDSSSNGHHGTVMGGARWVPENIPQETSTPAAPSTTN